MAGVKTTGAASPKILRLDHLVLTVADIAATCAFYERVFGFEIVESKGRFSMLFGAQKINLHQRGEEIKPHALVPTPGSADLCFTTKMPATELLRHFEVEGVPIELGPSSAKVPKAPSSPSTCAIPTATSSRSPAIPTDSPAPSGWPATAHTGSARAR